MFARAVAEVVREETEGATYYTPVNEISYNAWSAGEVGYMAPCAHGRGSDLKRALVRASIAAANAIWEVDPAAVMLNVDPLVRLHPPPGRPDLQMEADHFNKYVVTEAFDMLCGRVEPELGGSRRHLGIPGFNYYAGNQWTISTPDEPQQFLDWRHEAWIPVSDLLVELGERYGGPLVIAETGSSGDGRAEWLTHLAEEAAKAISKGVDLQGICLYPIVTSPDWEDPAAFFDGGLFDLSPQPDGLLKRVISVPMAAALREAQSVLDPANVPPEPLAQEEVPEYKPAFQVAAPKERAHFKVDNFSYQTLLAGNQLAVELYGFEPGASLPAHRHAETEHVWTFLSGVGDVRIGSKWYRVKEGETVLVPARLYHGIHNYGTERLIVQQVSAPKLWDARFNGPHPAFAEPQENEPHEDII
jgi:quercetin dioxygenase-like cupin family protein